VSRLAYISGCGPNWQPASVKPVLPPRAFSSSGNGGVVVRLRRASGRRRLGPNRTWPLTAVRIFSASIQIEYAAGTSNDGFGVLCYSVNTLTYLNYNMFSIYSSNMKHSTLLQILLLYFSRSRC